MVLNTFIIAFFKAVMSIVNIISRCIVIILDVVKLNLPFKRSSYPSGFELKLKSKIILSN